MAKINILDSSVYNKIAAGEVVERPSSIVKELFENSVDAGASKIEIEVTNGGLDSIKVTDNGSGIDSSEVEKAFFNHSTSKLKNEDDLFAINTLGFRGEALSSIAAVSKTQVVTKTADSEFGVKLLVEGGIFGKKEPVGTDNGTTITVRDLFFNTPARKKFLKKPSGEGTAITNLVERLILANPDIQVKYVLNGNTVYHSQGKGLESAIFAVYGKNTLDNCKKISWFYKDIEVNGFVGNKNFTKPNRTYQTTVINGRYVSCPTVCSAMQRAFEKFLMTRSYPFFVLHLKLPADKIDVNVHPNKMEVKFEDSQSVFYSVYIPVKDCLDGDNKSSIPEIEKKSVQIDINSVNSSFCSSTAPAKQETQTEEKIKFDDILPLEIFRFPSECLASPQEGLIIDDQPIETNFESEKHNPSVLDFAATSEEENKNFDVFNEAKFIGSIFDTYLLFELKNDIYLIDQHAAHEMILFDEFEKQYESKKFISQPLLIPYVFTLKYDEAEFLLQNLQSINSCGFFIEEFGENSFKITSIPLTFADINPGKFIDSVLSDLGKINTKPKLIKDIIAKSACKAAVKAGDSLKKQDIDYLKSKLSEDYIMRCPHGRPVAVKVSKAEIEKWFKRIV